MCPAEAKGRWRRDGIVCLVIGLVFGVLAALVNGWDPFWTVPCGAVAGGVLGAVFGPRAAWATRWF